MRKDSDPVAMLQSYFNDAKRTANENMPPLNPIDSLLMYLCIGLADESSELLESYSGWVGSIYQDDSLKKNFLEEMGDVCWHLVLLHGYLTGRPETLEAGIHLYETDDTYHQLINVLGNSLEILGIMKKVIYHKHPVDAPRIELLLKDIYSDLNDIASRHGGGLEAVLRTNVEKLKRRYPQGFTYEDSRNRQDEEKNAEKAR